MNTKTTLVLAVLAAAIASYVLLYDKPWETKEAVVQAASTAKPLYETKFDDADRLEVQRKLDGKKLVFAKDAETKSWKILEPIQAPATEYQVKQILDKLGELKYVRKYAPGDKDRPDDKVSGLDKPAVTVRVAKGDKEQANVLIGDDLPTGKGNYVKLAGSEDVLETQGELGDSFNAKLDSFRDKNVVKFDLADVKRVKVEGARNYTLVKNGDNWVLESPVRCRADKSKVENAVRALSSLYIADFKDDAPVNYKVYGLEPARLKVTVDTEKKVPPKAKPGDPNTQPADIEPSVKQASYELEVGGPADQGAKQYFSRLGNQPWVFSINEYTYKQLTPEVSDLQDKKIAAVTVARAKSVKVETADGAVTFTRQEGNKWVDGDGKAADSVAVDDLLKAVSGLQAVEYVNPDTELVKVDWDKPRARVTVTEEGSLAPVTVLVGPASTSGKMVFVRNAAEEPVAAVHDDAVAQLLAGPVAYRDRSVLKFDRARATRLDIAQEGKEPLTLTQKNNRWSISEPVEAATDGDAMRSLMQDLSNLQAKRVAGSGDKAKFGLDKPAVSVAVYVTPLTALPNIQVVGKAETKPAVASQPATTRPAKTLAEQIKQVEGLIEFQKTNPKENPMATDMLKKRLAELKQQAASQPASAPAAVAETPATQPVGPTVLKLQLARKDGKVYAAADGNEMIYEIDNQIFTDITAELHDRQVVKVEDAAKVAEVEFVQGDNNVTLRKAGEDWKYVLDPVLPIDKEKVTKALDDFKDVKTHRYVSYKADLAQYGLDAPASKFSVVTDGGQRVQVLISAKGPQGDADKSVYAALAGQNKVFLLKPDQVTKFNRKLDEFEKGAAGGSL